MGAMKNLLIQSQEQGDPDEFDMAISVMVDLVRVRLAQTQEALVQLSHMGVTNVADVLDQIDECDAAVSALFSTNVNQIGTLKEKAKVLA